MAEIAGDALLGEMGPYDLCMLLCSAYLHDIGMTPPVSRLNAHTDFLISGDVSLLDDDEQRALQAWLDEEADGLVPPIAHATPSSHQLRRVRQLLAEYTRFRHNDWSELWIEQHVANFRDKLYSGWVVDLVRLCRSHQTGMDVLRGSAFNPRMVGSPATVLHLRFCGCLLRLADVLDFDPERTPTIIYAHRDVDASSAIFWHKDHELSFVLDGAHISIYARPPDAVTHRAVALTVADIDRELLLVRRLADDTNFDRMAGRESNLPHRWEMETRVRADVSALDGRYEYVDGTFRPDPSRVLDLIGGLELYGSRHAAVREMLQNAFDAVKEQIAWQRLASVDPSDEQLAASLQVAHRVTLRLEKTDRGFLLSCADTGAGMSRELLTSRFLVGGTSSGHEIRSLERRCKMAGFALNKTSRFGIGVLSYFILGSQLRVRTRRSIEAGDPDGTGWTFTTLGLADFGELQRTSSIKPGTEVQLLLRGEVFDHVKPQEFVENLRSYIQNVVRDVPCAFVFEARGFDLEELQVGPGWTASIQDLKKALLAAVDTIAPATEVPMDVLSSAQRQTLSRKTAYHDRLRESANSALRVSAEEGALEAGIGSYRVHTGHFDLEGGPSLAFFDIDSVNGDEATFHRIKDDQDGFTLPGRVIWSWNGMGIRPVGDPAAGMPTPPPNTTIEIDLTDDRAGQLAVHRGTVDLSNSALSAYNAVVQRASLLVSQAALIDPSSLFALINARLARLPARPDMRTLWLVPEGRRPGAKGRLAPLVLPVIDDPSRDLDAQGLEWRGAPVSSVPALRVRGIQQPVGAILWHSAGVGPSTVAVAYQFQSLRPTPVWEEGGDTSASPIGPTSSFPPSWRLLTGLACSQIISSDEIVTWNPDNPLVKALDAPSWDWANSVFHSSLDPLPLVGELLASPSRVAAWILMCLTSGAEQVWNGIPERSEEFLLEAWQSIEGLEENDSLLFWAEHPINRHLAVLSTDSFSTFQEENAQLEFGKRMPPANDDWWLRYGDNGSRELRWDLNMPAVED